MNQNNWHVMVINNTPRALSGLKARTMVFDLNGKLQYGHTDKLTAAPGAATDAGEIAFPENLSAVHFVKLELLDAHNHLISDNFYWRAAEDNPDDFQALNQLPMVALEIRATSREKNGKCLINISVHNPAHSTALMAHLQLRRAYSHERVLPVYYGDNYLSLLPGETKSFAIEAASADLGGEPPLLAVDGWNVTVNPSSVLGSSVEIVPNTDAQDIGASAPRLVTPAETSSSSK
jgi:beta-mannosidase